MAYCFFACLPASTTPQQPYIFYSESPSLFKHQLMIRKLKMDQTGAKELTKPAWPQVLQQTHSDKACVGHQAS